MLEHHRARLLAMTLGAAFILPRHREAARRFHDVAAVRIVALHAIHPAFDDGMMLRQIKFRVRFEMALETGGRVFAGIENKFARTTGLDVQTARPVTGFAASLPSHRAFKVNARVRAGGKFLRDGGVAIGAGFVADEMSTGNFRRRENRARDRGA